MYIKQIITIIVLLFIITGCKEVTSKEELYNKPAAFWYKQIIQNVKLGNLDKADGAYTSLASEHVASPYLKEAMMILIEAHKENDEHLMAKYYTDEYTKRYATSNNIEYLRYLKIKSDFKAFKKSGRDQKLLLDTIENAKQYISRFPSSTYNPLVNTMLTKLYMADIILNKQIIALYKRTGKQKAAKVYEDRIKKSWLSDVKINEADDSFIKQIF
jgi:outer membrane protein assembly factor BamD